MGKPKTPAEVKKEVGANLTDWYKRNADRFKLIDGLTLDCSVCKMPEARKALKEMTEEAIRKVIEDGERANKQNAGVLKDVPTPYSPDLQKQMTEAVEDFLTLYKKNGLKLKLEFDPKKMTKEPPKLKFEYKW